MEKHILVALPLSEAQRETIRQAAPQFAYRFTTQETVTLEEILWADAILGNVPVELIRQNTHLVWFQSNFAGPDPYLEPRRAAGRLRCHQRHRRLRAGHQRVDAGHVAGAGQGPGALPGPPAPAMSGTPLSARCVPSRGARVLCVGMGDIGASFARRAHLLGAQVVGVRRHAGECPDYCLRVVDTAHLDEELPQADLVALSLPGTPETYRMFDAAPAGPLQEGRHPYQCGPGQHGGLRRPGRSGAERGALRGGHRRDRPRTAARRPSAVGAGYRAHHPPTSRGGSACPKPWTTSWASLPTICSGLPTAARWITR